MPWNLVSCWSSSDSEPVSTRCSPSAMLPRRNRLFALIASLGDGGLVDIAQVPSIAPQSVQRRRAVLAALVGENPLQRRMHILRHRVRVTTDVDGRAILQPRVHIAPRIPQRVLHVALLWLITREGDVQPRQHATFQQILPFQLIQEVVRIVAMTEEQPVPA